MTFSGKNEIATRVGSLVGVPGQTSYANAALAGLTTAGANDRKHYSYIAGDYVYVMEGNTSGSGGLSIFRAPTYDPTNLVKTGTVANYRLTTAHDQGTVLIVGDYVYMYGNVTQKTAIFRAPLSCPENWSDTGATLPFSVSGVGAPMAVIGSTIYAFGNGTTGTGDAIRIFTAPVSTPTVFSYSGFDLPVGGRYGSGLAVTPTKIFLYGGNDGSPTNFIYSADIGDPLTWVNTGSTLPVSYGTANVYVSDNYIYLISGRLVGLTSAVYRSPIADGLSFSAVQNTNSSAALVTMQAVNGRLYMYGGEASSSVLIQDVTIADLDNNVLSPWKSPTRSIPTARWAYASWVEDDTFYLYGGMNSSHVTAGSTVQTCSVHGENTSEIDGYTSRSPTNFRANTTALPTGVAGWQVVRIDDTLWFFGGLTASATFCTKIFSASISAPQTLTQVHATNGPSSAFFKAFIYNGYIYGIGGDDEINSEGNAVFKAPITNPGGVWVNTANTLPATLTRYSLAVIGNYVYLFGGAAGVTGGTLGAASSTVYRSLLTELDTVGSANWVTVTSLATATSEAIMVMSNGYLYLIGGSSGGSPIGTIQGCLISDLAGGVSNFKALGNFSPGGTNLASASAVYSDGHFYIPGGRTAVSFAASAVIHRTVQNAPFKTFGDVKESGEAVPAINLESGSVSAYNYFMQTGNFPWLYAKTT